MILTKNINEIVLGYPIEIHKLYATGLYNMLTFNHRVNECNVCII